MSDEIMIFCLTVCIIFLAGIVIYQQFAFHTGTKAKLREISCKLKQILDSNSDEKVMIFTDNKVLVELAEQINRMLENRQKKKLSTGGLKWRPKGCFPIFLTILKLP